jgi:hypothetical protein
MKKLLLRKLINQQKEKMDMVRKKSNPPSKIRHNLIFLFIAGVIIGGLGVYHALSEKNSSPTESNLGFPDYVYTDQKTLLAYKKSVEYQDMLMYIPCYCGCGIHSGHLSAKNCFIKEGGGYDDHGANCNMCKDIVLEATDMFSKGKPIPEVRSYINSKYGKMGPPTNTPLTPAETDISKASLPENFDSLSDALKLTPAGVQWAQFINVKLVYGTPLEPYITDRVQPDSFYWKRIVGMYSADYRENSWIELHDVGADVQVTPRKFPGMDNVVATRPFIYGHIENVKKVLELLKAPSTYPSAYETFKPVLKNAKDREAGIAFVTIEPKAFADMAYSSLKIVNGRTVEKIVVYRVTNSSALNMADYEDKAINSKNRGFTEYEVEKEGELLNIRMVGDIDKVLQEDAFP